MSINWAERKLGKSEARRLRKITWIEMLQSKKNLLIDTPDYSKTDRRLMAKDLDEIYWLWNVLSHYRDKPNLVIAIQKEMFRDHFFFDKMEKIELQPLRPQQMLEAYRTRFKSTHPFTEEALLTLARMSRGIFRRFLRYITLTLDSWTREPEPREPIKPGTVKTAVTDQRLAEDMEHELSELFPKQSELRLQAVRLLLHLQESGPQRQSQLQETLDLKPYAITRLLTKLELYRYVTRERKGNDKIVSLGKN